MISSYRSLRVVPLISSRLVVVICCFSDRVVPKIYRNYFLSDLAFKTVTKPRDGALRTPTSCVADVLNRDSS